MSEDEEVIVGSIYLMPTEPYKPPRAVFGYREGGPDDEEGGSMVPVAVAIFSADMGTWCLSGVPLPPDVAEAISDHARNLGVPGF